MTLGEVARSHVEGSRALGVVLGAEQAEARVAQFWVILVSTLVFGMFGAFHGQLDFRAGS